MKQNKINKLIEEVDIFQVIAERISLIAEEKKLTDTEKEKLSFEVYKRMG